MMKNAFYFMLKALVDFVFNFCPAFMVIRKIEKKVKIILKFAMSLAGKKLITTILILPNILRSKGDLTMKFGQLIEYRVLSVALTFKGAS